MRRAAAPSRLAAGARRRPDLAALAAVLVIGRAARIWLTFVWHPAITGYSDSGARLLALVTLVLLLFPIATTGYDYRYVIPTLGPLTATAALGGWGIQARIARRRSARTPIAAGGAGA